MASWSGVFWFRAAELFGFCDFIGHLYSLFLFHFYRHRNIPQQKILKFYLKVKTFSKWKCKNVFMFNFFILFFFSSPLIRHIYSLHIVDCVYTKHYFFLQYFSSDFLFWLQSSFCSTTLLLCVLSSGHLAAYYCWCRYKNFHL